MFCVVTWWIDSGSVYAGSDWLSNDMLLSQTWDLSGIMNLKLRLLEAERREISEIRMHVFLPKFPATNQYSALNFWSRRARWRSKLWHVLSMACWPFDLPSRLRSPVILPVYVHELFFCNNIRVGSAYQEPKGNYFSGLKWSKTCFTKISLEVIGRSTDR